MAWHGLFALSRCLGGTTREAPKVWVVAQRGNSGREDTLYNYEPHRNLEIPPMSGLYVNAISLSLFVQLQSLVL
jgi:hypothetical protein